MQFILNFQRFDLLDHFQEVFELSLAVQKTFLIEQSGPQDGSIKGPDFVSNDGHRHVQTR